LSPVAAFGADLTATLVVSNFGQAAGWSSDHLFRREMADVNGDGKADLLGFGQAGTLVSMSNGDGTFGNATLGLANFGAAKGWAGNDSFGG